MNIKRNLLIIGSCLSLMGTIDAAEQQSSSNNQPLPQQTLSIQFNSNGDSIAHFVDEASTVTSLLFSNIAESNDRYSPPRRPPPPHRPPPPNRPPDNRPYPPPNRGSYFDWAQGNDGWGYCYEWTQNRDVLNNGYPVDNYNCERAYPSHFSWNRGTDGWGYCYQYTPYGHAMNSGRPVNNYSCERTSPSFYRWGRSYDGFTYCYQYTGNGIPMNQGRPADNYYCR